MRLIRKKMGFFAFFLVIFLHILVYEWYACLYFCNRSGMIVSLRVDFITYTFVVSCICIFISDESLVCSMELFTRERINCSDFVEMNKLKFLRRSEESDGIMYKLCTRKNFLK